MKKILISTAIVFVFLFVFDWLLHGFLMMEMYQETAHIWRSKEAIVDLVWFTWVFQLALAFFFSYLFDKGYESKGLGEGVRFGFYMGILIGILDLRMYPYFPITEEIAIYWFFGGIFKGLGTGLTLAFAFDKLET
ncbi:MAG: hypothetical protein CMO81_06590 [Waddliaceae bacterium]|nr:hypothetical protein [Waddliaceae bacterium]